MVEGYIFHKNSVSGNILQRNYIINLFVVPSWTCVQKGRARPSWYFSMEGSVEMRREYRKSNLMCFVHLNETIIYY